MMIPCLCSFTVPSSPSAELPTNKKRTQTLSHRESGSSTNCMVGLNGIELAKEIRSSDKAADIIFLTSSPEFAVESYTVKASNYLVKPV